MPIFQYRAIDEKGKDHRGVLEANTPHEAREKLRTQGLMAKTLSPKAAGLSRESLKGEALSAFTMQLSQLLNAGLPLYESLKTLEEQYRGERMHPIILSLAEKIQGGASLSEAMALHPESFNSLYCSMVAAGEAAGALDIILQRLSELLEKQQKLSRQLVTAMIYPAVLAGFCMLVMALLLGFVVPSIKGIFGDRELNGFTQAVFAVSYIFNQYGLYIIVGGVVTICTLIYQLRKPSGRLWLEKVFLRTPIVRTLMVQGAIARFSRTMATLGEGGLTMIDSLRLARGVLNNHTLEEIITQAEERIIEGSTLSVQLHRFPLIPTLVFRMLAVGEETGNTTSMWQKLADIYEGEVEKTVSRLMALAQPGILLIMGVLIGSVLLAILLPLTDVSSFAE